MRYVGPREELRLTSAVLARAVLYAQPGGGELKPAYRRMRRYETAIREFVADGGRYLGLSLPRRLPGGRDAGVRSAARRHGPVHRHPRCHDRLDRRHPRAGPLARATPSAVLPGRPHLHGGAGCDGRHPSARYPNGENAALIAAFGTGAVGVVGPHPEATPDWYRDTGLVKSDGLDTDLGHDLIEAVMTHCSVRIPLPRRSSP